MTRNDTNKFHFITITLATRKKKNLYEYDSLLYMMSPD